MYYHIQPPISEEAGCDLLRISIILYLLHIGKFEIKTKNSTV